jgi:hypothetical protein
MSDSDEVAAYNNRIFSPELYRRMTDPEQLDFQPDLHPGQLAPEVTLTDLEGRAVKLSQFRGNKHLVMELGSITSPIFINDIADLNRIQKRFLERDVQFVLVYTREAHGAENYKAHTSMEQKIRHAKDLVRLETVDMPVLVDSLGGEAHHKFGLIRPCPVWGINKDGRVFYKAGRLVPDELELVLDHLFKAEEHKSLGRRLGPAYSEIWSELWVNQDVHKRVLERAGASARKEVTHGFGIDPVTHGRKA